MTGDVEISDRELQDEIVAFCRENPWCDAEDIRQDLTDYCDKKKDFNDCLDFFWSSKKVNELLQNCVNEKTIVSAFDTLDQLTRYSAVVA